MFIINNKTLWLFESDLAGKENSIYKVASTKEFNQGIYMIIFLLLGETKLNKKLTQNRAEQGRMKRLHAKAICVTLILTSQPFSLWEGDFGDVCGSASSWQLWPRDGCRTAPPSSWGCRVTQGSYPSYTPPPPVWHFEILFLYIFPFPPQNRPRKPSDCCCAPYTLGTKQDNLRVSIGIQRRTELWSVRDSSSDPSSAPCLDSVLSEPWYFLHPQVLTDWRRLWERFGSEYDVRQTLSTG